MPQYPDWQPNHQREAGTGGKARRREIFMAVRSFVIGGGFTYSQTSARHTRNKEGCGWRREGGREGGPILHRSMLPTTVRNERFAICFETPIDSSKIPCVKASEMRQSALLPYSAAASRGIVFHRELSMAFINFPSLPPLPAFLSHSTPLAACVNSPLPHLTSKLPMTSTAYSGCFTYILGSSMYFFVRVLTFDQVNRGLQINREKIINHHALNSELPCSSAVPP